MLRKSAITVFALCASLSAAYAGDAKEGKVDFETYCAPCHGLNGAGDGPVATELTKKPLDLRNLASAAGGQFPHEKIKKLVDGRSMPRAHGTPEMPVWGRWFSFQATAGGLLQEDQKGIEKEVNKRLENLISYLKTIQK